MGRTAQFGFKGVIDMSLIDDVKSVCEGLASLGWRDPLLAVANNALDIF